MKAAPRSVILSVALALLVTVVTQLVYITFLGGPQAADPEVGVTQADRVRYMTEDWPLIASVWMTEVIAFSVVAVGALVALARHADASPVWAALVLFGLFNLVQIGVGLSMFRPVIFAGEQFGEIAEVVVAGAFFFYFLAKVFVGVAGFCFGLGRFRSTVGMGRALGLLTTLAGLAAVAANLAALPQGRDLTFVAGATGTVAALLLGIGLLMEKPAEANG